MKVGFVVECGPEGAETKVLPLLAQRIAPDLELEPPVPLGKKPQLTAECGAWVKELLERGCDRVLIVWDLMPDLGEYEGKGCRHDDRERITESLRREGIAPGDSRVRLVCVEKMLEAWLIADERALSKFLSTPSHPVRISRRKRTEDITDPKSALNSLFKKSGGRVQRYVDYDHAEPLAQRFPDLSRLEALPTFRRFVEKMTR